MGKFYITYLCISVYANSRDGKVGVRDLKETYTKCFRLRRILGTSDLRINRQKGKEMIQWSSDSVLL